MKNNFYKQSIRFMSNSSNTAYIAIGSNKGDRFTNISKATQLLRNKLKIIKTSQIYENPSVDEKNQIVDREDENFMNAAIKVQTDLNPFELLSLCREIEKMLGREDKKVIYNQPRDIDLDIIFYNDDVVNSEKLKIPHQRVRDRLFVLKPLLDIDSNLRYKETEILTFLHKLSSFKNNEEIIKNDCIEKLIKISCFKNKHVLLSNKLIMGIINVTNDSFSNNKDLLNFFNDVKNNQSANTIEYLITNFDNIDIIDIGGQSTRPNADLIDEEVELQRILPLIKAIKQNDRLKKKLISVDTRKR